MKKKYYLLTVGCQKRYQPHPMTSNAVSDMHPADWVLAMDKVYKHTGDRYVLHFAMEITKEQYEAGMAVAE